MLIFKKLLFYLFILVPEIELKTTRLPGRRCAPELYLRPIAGYEKQSIF